MSGIQHHDVTFSYKIKNASNFAFVPQFLWGEEEKSMRNQVSKKKKQDKTVQKQSPQNTLTLEPLASVVCSPPKQRRAKNAQQ